MLDKDPAIDGFWRKARYLFLIAVYSVAYFIYAVAVGVWEWTKGLFKRDA